jgi:hypothetical protein
MLAQVVKARPLPGSFMPDTGVISQAAERIADARCVGGSPGTKDEKRCLRLRRVAGLFPFGRVKGQGLSEWGPESHESGFVELGVPHGE